MPRRNHTAHRRRKHTTFYIPPIEIDLSVCCPDDQDRSNTQSNTSPNAPMTR